MSDGYYVGQRVRWPCMCGKTFQTTIISPGGNKKHDMCRECTRKYREENS